VNSPKRFSSLSAFGTLGSLISTSTMVSSVHEHHDYIRRNKFASPVSKGKVEAEWYQHSGISTVAEMRKQAGDLLRKGVEKRDELLVVAQGKLECCVGEYDAAPTICLLSEGDELFIPRLTPFEARVPDDIDSVLFYIGYE
jgi:hypothetical protein